MVEVVLELEVELETEVLVEVLLDELWSRFEMLRIRSWPLGASPLAGAGAGAGGAVEDKRPLANVAAQPVALAVRPVSEL